MPEENETGDSLDVRAVITEGLESAKYERDGWALCCSGGGYKSGAFQVGAFIRLNELGVLGKLKRIASVSGGSIASAYLGLRWKDLLWEDGVATNFHEVFVAPMTRFFTSVSLDVKAVAWGALPHTNGAKELEKGFARHLFGEKTLQDFPDEPDAPRFVILATNFGLNSLWRFAKPYAADYRIGMIDNPRFSLAKVVTASAGFPPVFCPVDLDLSGYPIRKPGDQAAMREVQLADGGIYDNMGLEPIWKRYGVLLVSNAGDPFAETDDNLSVLKKLRRTMSMVHRQAENNRVRWLMALAGEKRRKVAYWPLRGSVQRFLGATTPHPIPNTLALSPADAEAARQESVRLKRLSHAAYERLARHGYSLCDAAVRGYLGVPNTPAAAWPRL